MDNEKIGVYIHWPFCTRLCPYCDFNIYKDKPEMADALTAAILRDLETWRDASGPRSLASIHFGGGTPSLMKPDHMRDLIDKVQSLWTPEDNLEIALEANPGDISEGTLKAWFNVGVERLSIGVQSFDDGPLAFLGRNHDAQSGRIALKLAIDIMPRVSADLIYGWVGQTKAHWHAELETAIGFTPGHISTYQLTIEEKTAFAQAENRGSARAVGEEMSADLFDLTGAVLGKAGYDRYEVSNFAKSEPDQSRHNKLYWQGADYVGVGPGAHGRLTDKGGRIATISALKPIEYIAQGASINSQLTSRESMSKQAHAEEYVLMGLRIREGISLKRYACLAGKNMPEDVITVLVDSGLLLREDDRLMATDQGRLLLDTISHQLLS